ncbi:MAG: hypothetical protein WBX25_30250 [Rhodomicrobium sp.]
MARRRQIRKPVLASHEYFSASSFVWRDSLGIIARLAKADPGNAGWQRDLSVSYDKVGDVLVAEDNLAEALQAYRDKLGIAERLAKADPGNAGWQRGSHTGVFHAIANGCRHRSAPVVTILKNTTLGWQCSLLEIF